MTGLSEMFGGGTPETFLGLPRATPDTVTARVAILGADRATPYASVGAYCAGGPAALRAGSADYATTAAHLNFDAMRSGPPDAADCGDIDLPGDPAGARAAIGAAVAACRARGARVVLLGGDDSVQIPMLAALEGPLWIVQVDAHIDWRDEVDGERMGLSSTQRRASEMAHVAGQVLVGARGQGSARASDLADARATGAVIVPAREVIRNGVARAVAAVPEGAKVAVCLDLDGLDPSVVPSVIAPTPGGLGYWDVVDLFEGLCARAEVVALGIVELMPAADRDGFGAGQAARLGATLLGAMAQDGD